ncbi:MAG: HK97 family phage prohead protease [Hydrogenophaga sp.]|uniref:HK97 family phage prohead protease n=1 Tax=Hydrogenophaga sp. TaxID=1904254 RepID=UPI00262E6585|nr:HK97 family phage prohead protease [Hydrogenophaga sp.]MCW5669402.1 HK97 family phage prohead protease [Hydrogenophaga sp.]
MKPTFVRLITKFAPPEGAASRRLRGVASTPLLDRQNEVVVPSGAQFTLPVPLLWNHAHGSPLGVVDRVEARADGLHIEAMLANSAKADEALELINMGGLSYSIGFMPLESVPMPGGGLKHTRYELLEISLTAVPAGRGTRVTRRLNTSDGSVKLLGATFHPGIPLILEKSP